RLREPGTPCASFASDHALAPAAARRPHLARLTQLRPVDARSGPARARVSTGEHHGLVTGRDPPAVGFAQGPANRTGVDAAPPPRRRRPRAPRCFAARQPRAHLRGVSAGAPLAARGPGAGRRGYGLSLLL